MRPHPEMSIEAAALIVFPAHQLYVFFEIEWHRWKNITDVNLHVIYEHLAPFFVGILILKSRLVIILAQPVYGDAPLNLTSMKQVSKLSLPVSYVSSS